MTKNDLLFYFVTCLILAVVCAILPLVTVFYIPELLCVAFISYTVTSAISGTPAQIPNFMLSQIVGWAFGYVYSYGLQISMAMGMSYPVAMFVVVLIVTFIILVVFFGLLVKTPANNFFELFICMAMSFIFFTFTPENANGYIIPGAAIAAFIGIFMGCLIPVASKAVVAKMSK